MENTGWEGKQKGMKGINLKVIATYCIIKGMGLEQKVLKCMSEVGTQTLK